jgi:zinc/manganese transport system permease protein
MNVLLTTLFEPGFLASEPVRTAMAIGGAAAFVSAVIGVFTVMRGQSFAGHALADVSSAGGAASFLLGINPLAGFLIMALMAAGAMELVRTRRARERDLVTGVVLGAGLGLAALFLYLDVTSMSTTGAAITIMFGSMFAIPASIVPLALAGGIGALAAAAVLYRPLLLSSIDPELAAVRGVPVRLVGLLHLLALALAVSLSAITVGAILSTALLIGPAAIALRVAKRPGLAIVLAALIGVGATWGGILLAYDSYYWSAGHGWPVSFFVVTIIFAIYLIVSRPSSASARAPMSFATSRPDEA